MRLIWIEVTDLKAYSYLEDLEAKNLIKVLKSPDKTSEKLSEKYAGKLSKEDAALLDAHVTQSRKSWNRDNF